MIQLTYISSPTRIMSDNDLTNIVNACRENNADLGITGMLLYTGDWFIQILEGEQHVVDELVSSIKNDSRHTDFKVIERKNIATREYSDWTMGFKRIKKNDISRTSKLNQFYSTDFNDELDSEKITLISELLTHYKDDGKKKNIHHELSLDEDDPFIRFLHHAIHVSVKILALLMMLTVFWCIIDLGAVLFYELKHYPKEDFGKTDILLVFGSFMIVLIGIEIFTNITLYIRTNVIPIKMVVATALMAVSRKVIVFDFHDVSAMHVIGTAMLIIALGITYWLIERELKIPLNDNKDV